MKHKNELKQNGENDYYESAYLFALRNFKNCKKNQLLRGHSYNTWRDTFLTPAPCDILFSKKLFLRLLTIWIVKWIGNKMSFEALSDILISQTRLLYLKVLKAVKKIMWHFVLASPSYVSNIIWMAHYINRDLETIL